MDSFSESQKQNMAVSFAALALYDGSVEITSESIAKLVAACGVEVESFLPMIFASFLTPEKISELLSTPGGSGGGGAAAGAGGEAGEEAAVEEEKKEEEEMDLSGGMSMFGDDEGGGDY